MNDTIESLKEELALTNQELQRVQEFANYNTFLQDENKNLKAQLTERISTANKIIAEKIDEIKKLDEVVDFLAECYRNQWDIDHDGISEILAGNFDYVRKQNQ